MGEVAVVPCHAEGSILAMAFDESAPPLSWSSPR